MEEGFIDILKQLVKEQGNAALTDAKKFKAFLADYTKNEYKKESRLFVLAVEAGVAKTVAGADDLKTCKKAMIRDLEEEYALTPAIAASIVDTLALLLRGDTTITVTLSVEKNETSELTTHEEKESEPSEDEWVDCYPPGFFHNPEQLNSLEKYVVPELIYNIKKSDLGKTIKIWSLGCSTGEEPYTIAMLLSEVLPPSWKFDILASNLSSKALMTAKKGFYADSEIVDIPDNYLAKYFDKVNGGYKVSSDLKSKINFVYHNLNNNYDYRGFDIVFCQHVLIYLYEAFQPVVTNRCWDAMASKSFLFIGHEESLFVMDTKFEFLKTEWATLYRKYI